MEVVVLRHLEDEIGLTPERSGKRSLLHVRRVVVNVIKTARVVSEHLQLLSVVMRDAHQIRRSLLEFRDQFRLVVLRPGNSKFGNMNPNIHSQTSDPLEPPLPRVRDRRVLVPPLHQQLPLKILSEENPDPIDGKSSCVLVRT